MMMVWSTDRGAGFLSASCYKRFQPDRDDWRRYSDGGQDVARVGLAAGYGLHHAQQATLVRTKRTEGQRRTRGRQGMSGSLSPQGHAVQPSPADQAGPDRFSRLRIDLVLMALRRRGLLLDIRLDNRRCLRPRAAPGGPIGCCRCGRRLRYRLHGCRSLASRRWSSGTLRCAPGFDHRSRSSLGGFMRLRACRLLELGVLLAQPGDGALQLDDLRLELGLAQLRRCRCHCRLSECCASRARNGRGLRWSGRLNPVLRAGRAAKPLPESRLGSSPGRAAGRLWIGLQDLDAV